MASRVSRSTRYLSSRRALIVRSGAREAGQQAFQGPTLVRALEARREVQGPVPGNLRAHLGRGRSQGVGRGLGRAPAVVEDDAELRAPAELQLVEQRDGRV